MAQQRLGCGYCRVLWRSGAPRSMKMGTIRSPFPYDAAAAHAIRSDNERRTAMLRDRAESTLTNYANSGITRS
jgi:hypothetical protein